MSERVGFEYRNKEGETAFEVFLRYSDEKENSSSILGRILSRLLVEEGMTFLDVGSGNGEYLMLSLSKTKHSRKTELTLLEPSKDLMERLKVTARQFPEEYDVRVVCSTFEDFVTEDQFDVILVSHVPLAKDHIDKLPEIYRKMLVMLKPKGLLIVVLRGKDDIHEFRTTFKSQLMGRDFRSVTIDDAIEILKHLAKEIPLQISKYIAMAKLYVPYPGNMQDTISLVEFFLNRRWNEFPNNIREAVFDYIRQKNGVLMHIDGFAVVKKKHSRKFVP